MGIFFFLFKKKKKKKKLYTYSLVQQHMREID